MKEIGWQNCRVNQKIHPAILPKTNQLMLEKGKPSEKVGRKVADLSLVLGDKVAELPGTKKIQPVILPETKQLMLEKGKPSEKVGRKVTDLSLLGDKVAELPGKSKDTSCNPAKNKPTDA